MRVRGVTNWSERGITGTVMWRRGEAKRIKRPIHIFGMRHRNIIQLIFWITVVIQTFEMTLLFLIWLLSAYSVMKRPKINKDLALVNNWIRQKKQKGYFQDYSSSILRTLRVKVDIVVKGLEKYLLTNRAVFIIPQSLSIIWCF